eukprot:6541311-Prymnesium_polylepis.3
MAAIGSAQYQMRTPTRHPPYSRRLASCTSTRDAPRAGHAEFIKEPHARKALARIEILQREVHLVPEALVGVLIERPRASGSGGANHGCCTRCSDEQHGCPHAWQPAKTFGERQKMEEEGDRAVDGKVEHQVRDVGTVVEQLWNQKNGSHNHGHPDRPGGSLWRLRRVKPVLVSRENEEEKENVAQY